MTTSVLLRSLHIPGNYMGFRQLCIATDLAVQNEDVLLNVYRDVYAVVAEQCNTNVKAVEKNIRTIINTAWLRGCKLELTQIAGYKIEEKPTAGEFLDIVSSFLRSQPAEKPGE